ncbi:MAG: galactose-1-epimerase [Porticoccaceae bacterium]|nr:galactose-1-epimerase [Porticoccaceae bacterium]
MTQQQLMTDKPYSDGLPAQLVILKNKQGLRVTLMDIGATWLSCIVPVKGEEREVLLGVNSLADFESQTAYLGSTIGRYANRINGGKLKIGSESYQLDTNQNGNTLHGGSQGFDKRRWQIAEQTPTSVLFNLTSIDGDQGFPGTVTVGVRYSLTDNNRIEINYSGSTDRPTVLNLTNHAYFNLLGAESGNDCLSHRLTIASEAYLPTNKFGIPNAQLTDVAGSPFDFRAQTVLGDQLQWWNKSNPHDQKVGFDQSYLLSKDTDRDIEPAATVVSPDDLITLSVFTDKPALQLYTGIWLQGSPNRSGDHYGMSAGLALETQFLPDSPSHPEWLSGCILKPEDEYCSTTSYQFDY